MPIAVRADVPARMLLINCPRCGSDKAKVKPGEICKPCQANPAVSREGSTQRVLQHGQARDARARELYGD